MNNEILQLREKVEEYRRTVKKLEKEKDDAEERKYECTETIKELEAQR